MAADMPDILTLLQSDDDSWARQRRIVAPNLNERISQVVWDEAAAQARKMVELMLMKPDGSRDTISGLRTLAMNVLGHVAYGQSNAFGLERRPRDPRRWD